MQKEDLNLDASDSEDVTPETHNKLLNAVSQIYSKKRIDKPVRSEPTSQISEFNLSHKTLESKSELVNVRDLVDTLNKRATHHEIKKKVNKLQSKSKTLRKPMEKLHADKIRRQIGYGNVKKQLDRWTAIVERNRGAEQLHFPLESHDKVSIEKDSHDFLKTFKEPTELEKKVAEILKTSEVAKEDEEQEKELFPFSLEEIIERRKMVGRMRARESYRIAKAIRQNKIKSKKYHRILKRERIKKELKDFEILQKTNPEAALEKLERIERARAEERISLRHRNTGKWAKSRAIRAKYDTEARAQLAEQLAKSRELTKKLKSGLNSSSEDEENDAAEDEEILKDDSSNPWKSAGDEEAEIKSFVEGFKKYQLQNKDIYPNSRPVLQDGELDAVSEESSNKEVTKIVNSEKNSEVRSEEDSTSSTLNRSEENKNVNNYFTLDSHEENSHDEVSTEDADNIEMEDVSEPVENKSAKNRKASELNRIVEAKSSDKSIKKKSTLKRISNMKTSMKKSKKLKNKSGVWTILPDEKDQIVSKSEQKSLSIDKLFDNAEDMLKDNLSSHIDKLKLNVKNIDLTVPKENKKREYQVDLSFKSFNKKPDADTALIEVAGEGISGGEHEVKSLINILEDDNKIGVEQNIDPNKFLPAKPSKLNSGGFNFSKITEEGEEDEEGRQLNLEEAFADDNVVDEFSREKEEEIENSKPKDVDLSLPGWGHWAGHDLNPNNKERIKRKKRRLIFKFPEVKRKDDSKDYVIINEDLNPALKKHMVHDLPFPFKSVKDYETSIRAPIGNTWVPQSAFMKLIKPAVVTKLGSIIEPMSESELLNSERKFFRKKNKI